MAKEYRVVYDNNKDGKLYTIEFGSHGWIRDLKVAQKLLKREQKRADSYSWIEKLYLQERETDEPDTRQPMREYAGRPVYNYDHLIWDVLDIGDFVEQEVADGILDALPPACMRSDCLQLGEPNDHILGRATYLTLARVSQKDGVWKFCGYCFRGQNTEPDRKEVA